MLKGRWFGSGLMQPRRRFTVCINLSTNPIDRWSFAGANIILILFLLQNSFITFLVWHLAWSIRMDLGTPWIAMYFVRKCSMFVAFALLYNLSVGNLETLSIHARKYTSLPWPSSIGPSKSNCVSSFGSTHGFSGDHLVFGIMLLRFLPNSVHGRHVFDLLIRSLFMNGHHNLWASSVTTFLHVLIRQTAIDHFVVCLLVRKYLSLSTLWRIEQRFQCLQNMMNYILHMVVLIYCFKDIIVWRLSGYPCTTFPLGGKTKFLKFVYSSRGSSSLSSSACWNGRVSSKDFAGSGCGGALLWSPSWGECDGPAVCMSTFDTCGTSCVVVVGW